MTVLCAPEGAAHELIAGIGPGPVAARDLSAAAALLDADPAETLVVVGPGVDGAEAVAFARMLQTARPAVGVVLVRAGPDSTPLAQAMQAGLREIVPAGDAAALWAACHRSLEVSRRILGVPRQATEPTPSGRIITVFAPKGGVGKTTAALNLGVALAAQGQGRVCVLDLDLEFGQVAISLGLDPGRTIMDALSMSGRMDQFGVDLLLTRYQPGLDTILAPLQPGDAERIPASLTAELLGVLRGMFAYIVVDTPPTLNEHVLTALDNSDHHVLVTTPEVPTLKNLRVATDTMDLLNYPREIRSVILNRANAKAGLTMKDVEQVTDCPVIAEIPSSLAVPTSINRGVPITLERPKHAVSRAITGLARRLSAVPVREREPEPPKSPAEYTAPRSTAVTGAG